MPEDTTPHGGEALHALPQRARIPDPPPQGTDAVAAERADAAALPDKNVIANRPPLPDRTRTLAADVEDEDADPVVDTGPGRDDASDRGVVSVTRQPGG